ncbi:MAG: carbohydrate binding family 9 domain-containing protein [Chlorobi bacterium]|nr:carbohydrate binding family 9 domain-containing protein [Chlorobiota bacterium]
MNQTLLIKSKSLLLLIPAINIAQDTIEIKFTDEKLKVDGVLSEQVWQQTPFHNSFHLNYPTDSGYARYQTWFALAYNRNFLYVAFKCQDSSTAYFVAENLKRDFSLRNTDAVQIIFNPSGDQQYGFGFAVSPYGSQREGLIVNGGAWGLSTAWDNKWFSAVSKNDSFWFVEMAIPFKTLRYRESDTLWRINAARVNWKVQERSTWQPVPYVHNISNLLFTGFLKWDTALPPQGLNLSVIPYVQSAYTDSITFSAGGDLKFMITPSLTLDATILPDFSQVEVDWQVLNLSRFSVFVPERRQFFLENRDLFSSFGLWGINIFFSRTVGMYELAPYWYEQVPIWVGLKLSGSVTSSTRLGIMLVQTGPKEISLSDTTIRIKPYTHEVFSIQQMANKPSFFRIQYVGRQSFERFSATEENHTFGIEYNLRTNSDIWRGTVFFAITKDTYVPDQDNFATGFYVRYRTRKWMFMTQNAYVGDNFVPRLGFIPRQYHPDSTGQLVRKGYYSSFFRGERTFYGKKINQAIGAETSISAFTSNNQVWRKLISAGYSIRPFRGDNIYFNLELTEDLIPFTTYIYGITRISPGTYQQWQGKIGYETPPQFKLTLKTSAGTGTYYTGTRTSFETTVGYRFVPYATISTTLWHERIVLDGRIIPLWLVSLDNVITFTTTLYWTNIIQYNTQLNRATFFSRFQWRFAPMSDIFLVWRADKWLDNTQPMQNSFYLKLVYWFNV